MANQYLPRLLGRAWLVASGLALASACNHAWSGLDSVATSASAASSTGASTGSGGGSGGGASAASSGGGPASSAASTGAGGGDAGTSHCGGTDLLSWDFASDQPSIFYHTSGTSLTGGEGVIALPTTAGGYWEQKYSTTRVYDLRGDRVFAKVSQVAPVTSQAAAEIKVYYDNGDTLFLREYHGTMLCGSSHGPAESSSSTPYDPSADVYWQLREDQGLIRCETSPDGVMWKEINAVDLSVTALSPPAAVRVALAAVINGANTVAGSAHFDDLNGGGPAKGHWCPASTLTETFPASGPVPGPAWDWPYANAPATFDQTGGTLNLREVGTKSAGYGSSASYDATGERVSVAVVALPTAAQGTATFRISNAQGFAGWMLNADNSYCAYQNAMGQVTIWQGPLPPLPAYVGLREAGGRLYCTLLEPTDGGAPVWKDSASVQMGLDVTAVDIGLFEYGTSTNTDAWVASFDNYNLPPVP